MSGVFVAFNGIKKSGKDTAGEYLIEQYGFHKMSFAQPLKESAAANWGFDAALWEEWKNLPNIRVQIIDTNATGYEPRVLADESAREYLQRYGTEAHREQFGQGFWIDNVTRSLAQYGKVVITDARFENECSALRQRGATIVRIERPSVEEADAHASEAPIPEHLIDVRIVNDGTLDEFYEKLEVLAQTLLRDPFQGRT